VGGSANPELVPNLVARIGADDVAAVIGAVTVVDEDAVAARALARTEVAGYLAVVADLDPTVELPPGLLAEVRTKVAAGDPEGAGRHIPDAVLDRFAISGTPQQVAARVEALFDAGADRVDLGTPHGLAAERGVELIGASVLPLLGSST
jgi:5,10-methylenetetrahydromethanopterin reductase